MTCTACGEDVPGRRTRCPPCAHDAYLARMRGWRDRQRAARGTPAALCHTDRGEIGGRHALLDALDALKILGGSFTREQWRGRFCAEATRKAGDRRWERWKRALRGLGVRFLNVDGELRFPPGEGARIVAMLDTTARQRGLA